MTNEKSEKKKDIEEVHVEVADELDEELEQYLQTPILHGLTDAQVQERILKFGKNEMPVVKSNRLLKFLGYFGGAISILLELAAIVCLIVKAYIDFGILVGVLILNAIIGFFEEAKAENALDALKNTLALKSRCWRNGALVEVDSCNLVPGDIIAIRLGDIIPADARLLGVGVTGEETEGALQIDQSALTGESLPVSKGKDAIAYSSSICKQGQMLGVVTKTGINTFIGRAANLISITVEAGHFQKVINHIGNFLIIITLVMVVIILVVICFFKYGINHETGLPNTEQRSFLEALEQVCVLTIAAIPVGLPTVLSVTMAVGASQLAKKEVIVKRLTAIEELASVSILCSDKTGTLTLNQLTFDKPFLANKGSSSDNLIGNGVQYTEEELLLTSYFSSEPGAHDPIETAVRKAAEEGLEVLKTRSGTGHDIPGYKVLNFIPFNPSAKYTEAIVMDHSTGKKFRCIKGAPQVITRLCGGHKGGDDAVIALAKRGLRALGVARTTDEEMTKFELVGMISLLDPPRHDSAQTIKECNELGVSVKMITGDQQIIGIEVAHRLGMGRTILDSSKLVDPNIDVETLTDCCVKADGFAQVIPEHKFKVVELLQNRGYLVGMTGDGVNDAPALKKANVGIAVEGCTDAARSAADIVLLASGLSTIVDGIKCSRAIFQRMRSYALYRIASTIHFLLFFFLSILVFDFILPNRLILMIAVLNDAATLVIAIDNARISKRPDKWRLGQLMTLSFILGTLLMIISFAHFYVLKAHFDATEEPLMAYRKLQTAMYLQISSCPHFVIFSTRVTTWWWKNKPSFTFLASIIGTQIVAMFMAVYGWEGVEAYPIGWTLGAGIMAISLVAFMFLDIVKVLVIRNWSFELTANVCPTPKRRQELKRRQARAVAMTRINRNFEKLRKCCRVIYASVLLRGRGQETITPPNEKV